MGDVISAHINNWRLNYTRVANAYSKAEDQWVWLCIHAKSMTTESITRSLQINAGIQSGRPIAEMNLNQEENLRNVNEDDWSKIPYRDYLKKQRTHVYDRMTVVDHEGKLVCKNYVIEANRSYIITKEGGIKLQQYNRKHENSPWEDDSGKMHNWWDY